MWACVCVLLYTCINSIPAVRWCTHSMITYTQHTVYCACVVIVNHVLWLRSIFLKWIKIRDLLQSAWSWMWKEDQISRKFVVEYNMSTNFQDSSGAELTKVAGCMAACITCNDAVIAQPWLCGDRDSSCLCSVETEDETADTPGIKTFKSTLWKGISLW